MPALSLLLLAAFLPALATTLPFTQPPEQVYNEAQTVYLGNLARRANGVPPLKWNLEMTNAARWFSWDSVENRPDPYCGHQDTLGNWPDYRIRYWGYLGFGGAENAFCGYVTPQQAIDGWMASDGHRANLLDPNSREVGLGYYRRTSDGRGYVTQDFGYDIVYPPMIIENEAINTADTQVGLYIYNRQSGGGFAEMSPATEMRISNEPCFKTAAWQPYTAEKSWALEPGLGWRSVYVQTRDAFDRTATVSDTIYLGSSAPWEQLGYPQMSTHRSQLKLYNLSTDGLPKVQLSLGWRVDNTFGTFGGLWGNGVTVSDAAAWGGSAYRMYPGDGESSAWVWTTEFIKDVPLVGYVRLKVSDNSSASEVARISVAGNTLILKGTDFASANQYQEFPIPFTFLSSETFLIFQFWRSGAADVYVDTVTIYTTPQPVSNPFTWNVPGGNYRGQGIWVRYTDDSGDFVDGDSPTLAPNGLSASRSSLSFLATPAMPPSTQTITISALGCIEAGWQAGEELPWLQIQADGDRLSVTADPGGLAYGTYTGVVTVAPQDSTAAALEIPVSLRVVPQIFTNNLPVIKR